MEHSNPTNVLEPVGPTRQEAAFPTADRDDAPARPKPGILSWLGRVISNALVLSALGGLTYWGHHTGWTVPTFAALTGSPAREKDDWCSAHDVPESECVECNPDLLPKGKDFGWCRKHGIPDCPFEHPEVAQLKQLPKISPADLERAQRALAFLSRPENNNKCKLHHRRIQFASLAAVEKAGIDVAPV